MRHFGAQMREFDFGAEVETFDRGLVPQLGGECPAVGVVTFELRVRERYDLAQERIYAHELVERITERRLVLIVERSEPCNGEIENGVHLSVLLGIGDR